MSINQKGNFLVIIGVLILLIAVGGGAYYLGTQRDNSQVLKEVNYQSAPSVETLKLLTSTNNPAVSNSNWEIMTIPTLGLTFNVPPRIAKLGEIKEEFSPGDAGSKLCVQFVTSVSLVPLTYAGGPCETDSPYLLLGTTSIDYTAGREGTFTDLEGFVYKDGKYLVNFVQKTPQEAFSQDRITKVENPHGVEIIKIKGKTEIDEGPTLSGSLGNNTGALINTKNQKYPGLAIIFKTNSDLTPDEVDKILVSFKFVD